VFDPRARRVPLRGDPTLLTGTAVRCEGERQRHIARNGDATGEGKERGDEKQGLTQSTRGPEEGKGEEDRNMDGQDGQDEGGDEKAGAARSFLLLSFSGALVLCVRVFFCLSERVATAKARGKRAIARNGDATQKRSRGGAGAPPRPLGSVEGLSLA
jgi:hypothetical protein